MAELLIRARMLAPGTATAEALVFDEPLSFWGGFDPNTGIVTDVHHPQAGASLRRRVIVMPSGRGSSSSSSVLAEAIRAGTGPAALILAEADPILALGSIVAGELYGAGVPVVVAAPDVETGLLVTVEAHGEEATLAVGLRRDRRGG